MRILFITLTILFISTSGMALTDHKCMRNCNNQGYMYNYCKSKCYYKGIGSGSFSTRTDYTCQNRCTRNGYSYSYCKEVCSY